MKKIITIVLIMNFVSMLALPVVAQTVSNEKVALGESIQPEPSYGEPVLTKKEKFLHSMQSVKSKLKINLKRKTENVVDLDDVTSEPQNDIFTAQSEETLSQKTEIKTIEQIREEHSQKSWTERHSEKRAESKMTVKERQDALADEVSDKEISDEITQSTTIKGSVEENVLVSIDDCVKLGLYNNPTIRYAISNSDIYKSKIGQAWSAYFPQLSVGTAFSRNQMLATNFKFPMMEYSLWNAVAIEGSMLFYDFGKAQKMAKIAKTSHEASISDIQSAINNTVYNVKASYYQYLFALRKRQVIQSTVDKFEKHYNESKAGYEVGVKAKIDVITAEYNLSNANLDLIKAKNQVEAAKAQLNNAMGLPAYSNYNVTDKMDIESYELNFDELIDKAYDLRPELQSISKRAEASKIQVTSSKLAFTPDLKGFGSYTLGGKEYADNYGYQLGVRLSYPTTNLFLLKKKVDEAKATYERDIAQVEQQRNDVYLDVKNAYFDYVNARDSVPVAHKAMNEAKLQYEIAAGRYKTGLNTAIELKDAEITYRDAQLNYYNALMLYNTAVAGVEKTVGAPIKPDSHEGQINEPIDVNL